MTRSDTTRQAQYTKAVAALLSTCTIQAAADTIGVTSRTMQRWMNEPEFQALLHEAQDAMLAQAAIKVTGLSGQAVSTLADVLADEDAPLGVKTRAADLALSNALRLSEQVSLAQRIRALEAKQKEVAHAQADSNTAE